MLASRRIMLMALIALLGLGIGQARAEKQPSAPVLFPTVTYQTVMGGDFQPNFAAAKLTVVHFWATWCAPCVKELPDIDALSVRYGNKLQMVVVSLDADAGKVQKFYNDHSITHLPIYLDMHNTAIQTYALAGMPTTFFINGRGEQVGRSDGPVDWNDPTLLTKLDTLLK